jgi:P-aminobenzoate N-oxygenase AurF
LAAVNREQTADRLLTASLEHTYDPDIEIDWSATPEPGRLYAPANRLTLYGTPLWDRLSDAQRIELSKHEVASVASVGIWFETILMQMMIRRYYDQDPTSRHAQYALTEIADECRHSIMFGRMIEWFGCRPYRVSGVDNLLGRWLKATATGVPMFAAILIAEEILDSLQREAAADESIQPLVRMVSRIHVVEEARHVRYAREELAEQVSRSSPAQLAYSRTVIGRAAYATARKLVQPRAYASVGIDPKVGARAAQTNPVFGETLRWAARRVTSFLDELGLIGGPGRRLWIRSRLIEP